MQNSKWLSTELQKKQLEVFCEENLFKNFANFTRKHLQCVLFLIKLQDWGTVTSLRIHWSLSTIWKTSHKSVWSNHFDMKSMFIPKVYSVQYTLKQNTNAEKIPSDKKRKTLQKSTFFLLRTPTHHSLSFTFNSQLWYKVYFSKTVCKNFHFRFRLVFINVCIFTYKKGLALWL